jgi:GAF domain-containing protein
MHDALGTIARRADLVEPLICRGNVLGAITLTGLARNPDGQPVEDRDSLVMFGMSAAIALENARLHAQEVRRSEELEALLSALQVITSGERLQDVLNRLASISTDDLETRLHAGAPVPPRVCWPLPHARR